MNRTGSSSRLPPNSCARSVLAPTKSAAPRIRAWSSGLNAPVVPGGSNLASMNPPLWDDGGAKPRGFLGPFSSLRALFHPESQLQQGSSYSTDRTVYRMRGQNTQKTKPSCRRIRTAQTWFN